jgi:hypothetical protein
VCVWGGGNNDDDDKATTYRRRTEQDSGTEKCDVKSLKLKKRDRANRIFSWHDK